MDKTRLRIQEAFFRARGISDQGIERLYRLREVSIPANGLYAMVNRGFSEQDANILIENWGNTRVRISNFHPKKVAILKAIDQGRFPSEIAAEFEVSKTYVLRLARG